jgi:hypothetical protein
MHATALACWELGRFATSVALARAEVLPGAKSMVQPVHSTTWLTCQVQCNNTSRQQQQQQQQQSSHYFNS